MIYTQKAGPNGWKVHNTLSLDDRSEKLFLKCNFHPQFRGFHLEDCRSHINIYCQIEVNVSEDGDDPEFETVDIARQMVPFEMNIIKAWQATIEKAADRLGVNA